MELLHLMWVILAVCLYYHEYYDANLIERNYITIGIIIASTILIIFGLEIVAPSLIMQLIAWCGFIAVNIQLPKLLAARGLVIEYIENRYKQLESKYQNLLSSNKNNHE